VDELRDRLAGAVAQQRQVRLEYYVPTRDESTRRVVDPLAVVHADGHTYLDAFCHVAEDQRLFRLDRISAAEVLDSPVQPHAGLPPRDLAAGIFSASEHDLLVTLRLSPAARWVAEYYPVEDASEEPGGGLTVRMRIGDPALVTQLMLRLGAGGEVLEPADLADQVRRVAAEARAHYN
jgi:proteasome accessory factor C